MRASSTLQGYFPEYFLKIFDIVIAIQSDEIVCACGRGLVNSDRLIGDSLFSQFHFNSIEKIDKKFDLEGLSEQGQISFFQKTRPDVICKGSLVKHDVLPIYLLLGNFVKQQKSQANSASLGFLHFPPDCPLEKNNDVNILSKCTMAEIAAKEISFYLDVYNELPGDVFVFSKDFKLLFANAHALSHNGKTDNRYFSLVDDENEHSMRRISIPDEMMRSLKKAAASREILRSVENKATNNGVAFWLKLVVPKLDVAGNVEFFLWFSLDITTDIHKEMQLTVEFNRVKDFFKFSTRPILELDHDNRIVDSNISFSNFFLSDTQARTLFDVIPVNEQMIFRRKINAFKLSGAAQNGVFKILYGQTEKFVSYSIFKNDTIKGSNYFIQFADITEGIAKEETLVRILDEKKLIEQEKGDFVNNFTHEIRNPLAVILSSTEILGLQLKDPDKRWDREKGAFLNDIKEQVNIIASHMDQLISMFKKQQ